MANGKVTPERALTYMRENRVGAKAAATALGVNLSTLKSWKRRHWTRLFGEVAAPLTSRGGANGGNGNGVGGQEGGNGSQAHPPGPSGGSGGAPPPRQGGRPPKLNQDIQDAICEGLRLGLPRTDAVARIDPRVGSISYTQVLQWVRLGKAAREYRDGISEEQRRLGDPTGAYERPKELNQRQQLYLGFLQAVERAEATAVTSALGNIRRAAQPLEVAGVDAKGRPVLHPDTLEPVKARVRPGDWRADAFFLRTRRGMDFTEKTETIQRTTGATDDSPIKLAAEIDVSSLSLDALREEREKLEEILRLQRLAGRAKKVGV